MSYYIIIRGHLGCGKTTIAKKLARILNAKHISIDKLLDKHKLTKDREEGYISQKSFIKANEVGIAKANKLLSKDISVIFDGNFYWKSQIEHLVNNLKFKHYIFTLIAPLELCIERDSKRKHMHGKDAAKVVYKKVMEFDYGTKIDATKSINEIIKDITSKLPKNK